MTRPRALLLAIALLSTGCASGFFGDHPHESREEAIAACIEAVPAEAVPYADRMADCMEERGWVYRRSTG